MNRPPNSPKRPSARRLAHEAARWRRALNLGLGHNERILHPVVRGLEVAVVAGRGRGPGRLDERLHLAGVLPPGSPSSTSTPVATSTPQGATRWMASADVVRREPAGHDHPPAVGRALGEGPVEHLARARAGRVDEDGVGAVVVGPRRGSGRRRRSPGSRTARRSRTHRVTLGRLVAVQLRGPQARRCSRSRPPAAAPRRGTPRR